MIADKGGSAFPDDNRVHATMTPDVTLQKLIKVSRSETGSVIVEFNFKSPRSGLRKRTLLPVLYLLALAAAVYGNSLLRDDLSMGATQNPPLSLGLPYLGLAVAIWLLAELFDGWHTLKNWWAPKERLAKGEWLLLALPVLIGVSSLVPLASAATASQESSLDFLVNAALRLGAALVVLFLMRLLYRQIRRRAASATTPERTTDSRPTSHLTLRDRLRIHITAPMRTRPKSSRVAFVVVALLASAYVWESTSGNQFSRTNVLVWLLSAVLWARLLGPPEFRFLAWIRAKLASNWTIPWRKYWWAIIAFGLIMALAGGFRLLRLEEVPAEVWNDVYFEARDAYYVTLGQESPVYFTVNNGRQPYVPYLGALLAGLPWLEANIYTVRLATALASVFTVPILFWLGFECVGRKHRRAAIVMGLLVSGLVAGSYWDVTVHRAGMSASFSHAFSALFAVFMVRAIRNNRRADFIFAGAVVGLGLFSYHSVRILPFVAVVITLFAVAVQRISWKERFEYVKNLAALALVAFFIALPILRFALESPDVYWSRFGQLVVNESSSGADWQATGGFYASALMTNMRNILLMFNYVGDGWFYYNVPRAPALGVFSGALLVLGLPALLVHVIKSRDRLSLCLPIAAALMLLPATTVVDPSDTLNGASFGRTVVALAFIYALAALPLLLIIRQLWRAYWAPIAVAGSIILCCGIFLLEYQQNATQYFVRYHGYLQARLHPGREGGDIVRGIIATGGKTSNIFVVFSDMAEGRYIWAEAGYWDYQSIVWSPGEYQQELENALKREEHRLDLDSDLYYLISYRNQQVIADLRRLFPQGYLTKIPTSRAHYDYGLYRVPALGEAGLRAVLALPF